MKISSKGKKTIALVFLCMFLQGAVMALMATTKSMLLDQYGITNAQMGVLFTFRSLSVVALLLVTGRLSDKFGRRPALLVGSAFYVLYTLTTPTVTTYPFAILAAIIFGVSYGFVDPSAHALLFDSMEKPTPIMPYIQVAFAFGGMVTPAIVNLLLKYKLNIKFSYYILALLSLLVFIISLFFKFPKGEKAKEVERSMSFKIDPKPFPDGLLLFLIVMFNASIQALVTTWGDVYAQQMFSTTIEKSLLVFSIYQFGCIAGALITPLLLKKIHVSKVILACAASSFVAICFALLAKSFIDFSIVLALVGLTSSSILTMCIGFGGHLFHESQGTATAAIGMANALSFVICSYFSGRFIDTLGARNIFLSLIVTVLMLSILSALLYIRYRHSANVEKQS